MNTVRKTKVITVPKIAIEKVIFNKDYVPKQNQSSRNIVSDKNQVASLS